MKKAISILVIICFTITACNKKGGNNTCDTNNNLCAAVQELNFDQTLIPINTFLQQLQTSLSDQEKMERLQNWLSCQPCVSNATILCVSCIETLPQQSGIKIHFSLGSQDTSLILDVLMKPTPIASRFHQ